jgi:hypothetical protein
VQYVLFFICRGNNSNQARLPTFQPQPVYVASVVAVAPAQQQAQPQANTNLLVLQKPSDPFSKLLHV